MILADAGDRRLRWWGAKSGNYTAQQTFTPPVPGSSPVSFDRGWASIEGSYAGERFRMVNTHLETEDFAAVQEAQTAEFLAGPARSRGAVIATGDFNSAADGSTTRSYALLTASFRDAWNPATLGTGLSCCQNETLTNGTSQAATRIDLRARSARGAPGDLTARGWCPVPDDGGAAVGLGSRGGGGHAAARRLTPGGVRSLLAERTPHRPGPNVPASPDPEQDILQPSPLTSHPEDRRPALLPDLRAESSA
ncbi:MAG: hypothetical protein IPK24_10975 [Kineosporiaceae bacterium]|nr:hypothetical protein [Kineosporiaceae bacterium]